MALEQCLLPDELLKPGQLSTIVELARKANDRKVGELSSR
jgi:hypothetical protein